MTEQRDDIYAQQRERIERFSFDERVVRVFPDMIKRSVPGYATTIDMIGVLAARYAQPDTCLYDLGCSLGAATLAMAALTPPDKGTLVAVDNSPAMIEKARDLLRDQGLRDRVQLRQTDVAGMSFEPTSVAVLNFTLQFIPLEQRDGLIQRLADATREGGILVLSEKIRFEDAAENALQSEWHHAFKRNNGYSDLEISQKRSAIEDVLLPETLAAHEERLRRAGYHEVRVWFRCFNFMSLVAIR
ncbi:methyltransferase [Alcanivorax xiamenensis]|uniref:Carboxy-S-adenosyl-L-methionine synthase n=1 Tax=Alcanivorax xiamenensis TaxID=1177156 RepID=A0ABQ6Y7A4_9GAMM|nr:carboxy-S-adenosyl-L-methionine synthase CmoA [Alcanivorax xiamenensis]KAF0805362.1 methyltransferase [Alcanivorax xiamenensis]